MLKISKLDINLPVDLVKSCASLPDSQLCKFVATNQDGEFQHSIEVRNKQDNVISLELSNLEISYEDGRFVAQIMQVFKVFQGDSGGQDAAASASAVSSAPPRPAEVQGFPTPSNTTANSLNKFPPAMAGKNVKKSTVSENPSSALSLPEVTITPRTSELSMTAVSQVSNRFPEQTHHPPVPPEENVVLPRQMFRNIHGAKRSEPSAALGSPMHESTPVAPPKRIRMHTETDGSPIQGSQNTNIQDTSLQKASQDQSELILNPGDTKHELIEIKIESDVEDDKSEDNRSDGHSHSQDAFLSQTLPASFDNQSAPFIQDFYSLTQDPSVAGPSGGPSNLSFPSTSSQGLVPNWQPPGDSSSSMDPPGQSPSKPRNASSTNIKGLERFQCHLCPKRFTRAFGLSRHLMCTHAKDPPQFPCNICGKFFTRKDLVLRHKNKCHN